MALPSGTPWSDGALRGTLYVFASAGDTLPMHAHDAATAHISIITRGAFRVHGPGWSQINVPGPVLSFAPGQAHEFVAIEANSVVLQIVKGEVPPSAVSLAVAA